MYVQTGGGSDVMVKINHNILMISCDEKKYSSDTSGRTEENHCMNYSQGSTDMLSKNVVCMKLLTVFIVIILWGKSQYKGQTA